MIEAGNNWELFGFDMRRIGKQWTAAWREFLWGYDSPIKSRLDETVRVYTGQDANCYHGGRQVAAAPDIKCEAVLLPTEAVLTKSLNLPLAVEAELEAVMALEVGAHSPFPQNDTGYGWKLLGRTETELQILLAVVSLSATMTFLGREYDCHDHKTYEVWAGVNGSTVVISGFGEGARLGYYRKRLIRVGAMLVYAAIILLLIFGVSAASKYFELQSVREMAAAVEREAASASELRSSLALAHETITAADKYVAEHPNPHRELARITKLLGDDVSVQQFTMNGRDIRLRGQARNAAEVMSQLTAEPAYEEVTAPQALTKLGNTGMERFVFSITLAEIAL